MKKIKAITLFLLMSIVLSPLALAQNLEVEEIIKNMNYKLYYQGKDFKAKALMKIFNVDGKQIQREYTILRLNIGEQQNEQKIYLYVSKPAVVRDIVYMVWKYKDSDDESWIYLPNLKFIKKIESNDKWDLFVDSHFCYEDISGRKITADTYSLLDAEGESYLIKSIPKIQDKFAYCKIYIDKKTFLPNKIEYYNEENNKYREVKTLKIEKVQGFDTIMQSEVRDVLNGGYTVVTYSDVQYNNNLPEKVFNKSSLKIVPRKWIN